jgi:hypothetical protein
MESGAGSSGSMGGLGIDSAGAGLGEIVLIRGFVYGTGTGVRSLNTSRFPVYEIFLSEWLSGNALGGNALID